MPSGSFIEEAFIFAQPEEPFEPIIIYDGLSQGPVLLLGFGRDPADKIDRMSDAAIGSIPVTYTRTMQLIKGDFIKLYCTLLRGSCVGECNCLQRILIQPRTRTGAQKLRLELVFDIIGAVTLFSLDPCE